MKQIKLLVLSFVFAVSLSLPSLVYAHVSGENDTATSGSSTDDQQNFEQEKAEYEKHKSQELGDLQKKRSQLKDDAKKNSEQRRLEALSKSCEKKSQVFKKRFNGITKRAEDRKGKFATILQRLEDYVSKNNLSVDNYDQLLSDADTKKLTLQEAHNAAKIIADTFNCKDENIKDQAQNYKQAVQTELIAFKDYKAALKSLIKAVKQSVDKSNDDSSKQIDRANTKEQN